MTDFSIDATADRYVLPEIIAAEGTVKTSSLLRADNCDAVVVVIEPANGDDGVRPTPGASSVSLRYGINFASLLEHQDATGRAGDVHVVDIPIYHRRPQDDQQDKLARQVIFLGIGAGTPGEIQLAGAALWARIKKHDRVVIDLGPRTSPELFEQFANGLLLAAQPALVISSSSEVKPRNLPQVVLFAGNHRLDSLTQAISTAHTITRGTWLARDWANTPSNIKSPSWLAEQWEHHAQAEGLDVDVYDETWLRENNFAVTIAVSHGSTRPPRLVVISYDPQDFGYYSSGRQVVLVGKGVTFDTGGLSLKPRDAMIPMKTDMAAAAAVVATVLNARRLGTPDKVTAVVPLVENAISGQSYRPGDVIRAVNGTSIEITNTDAEGRLILAEALAWSAEQYSPDALIDVATLTGAARASLGNRHAATYSNEPSLMQDLAAASERSQERIWPMPLIDAYRPGLESVIADIRQTAPRQWNAGSVMAALFLEHFVPEETAWAHLDIAGAARAENARPGVPAGATGFGVSLLSRYLMSGSSSNE